MVIQTNVLKIGPSIELSRWKVGLNKVEPGWTLVKLDQTWAMNITSLGANHRFFQIAGGLSTHLSDKLNCLLFWMNMWFVLYRLVNYQSDGGQCHRLINVTYGSKSGTMLDEHGPCISSRCWGYSQSQMNDLVMVYWHSTLETNCSPILSFSIFLLEHYLVGLLPMADVEKYCDI